MTTIHSFRDLIVWQRSVQLSVAVYKVTEQFPTEERFGLSDQMRRASISIISNIAEGRHRGSKKEFIRFLSIAYASARELEAQLHVAKQLPRIQGNDFDQCDNLIIEVSKMLNIMIQKMLR